MKPYRLNKRSFAEVVRDALEEADESAISVAEKHGMKRDAIRSVLRGQVPSIDRAAQICEALDLEIYVGPQRGPSGMPSVARVPDPIPKMTVWPGNWLMQLAHFFNDLPEECPFAGPDRECPLLAKAKKARMLRA